MRGNEMARHVANSLSFRTVNKPANIEKMELSLNVSMRLGENALLVCHSPRRVAPGGARSYSARPAVMCSTMPANKAMTPAAVKILPVRLRDPRASSSS